MDASTPPTALKLALRRRGSSGRWLAGQTGIHESDISRFVNGKDPGPEHARSIAAALDLTVAALGWPHHDVPAPGSRAAA